MDITAAAVWYAFALTLFAGLATGLGSALAFVARQTNTKFLSIVLGFSAGVMVYVSFVEIFAEARHSLVAALGEASGSWAAAAAFFGGIAFIAIIDKFVPDYENPHEMHFIEEMDAGEARLPKNEAHDFAKLRRTGIFAALAIAIHNFPEGLATFTAALADPKLGLAIAVAIAIHNIPEGISVSVPIFYATGSRRKAFAYSFASGLAEPVGVIVGYTILRPFMNDVLFGVLFASVAGIMVFISLDELIPTAREYGGGHLAIYGVVAGMAVMALSLLMFL